MFYKKLENGYITMFGEGDFGTSISESEYKILKEIMRTRPKAPKGFDYKLTANYEWELYELPVFEEEAMS